MRSSVIHWSRRSAFEELPPQLTCEIIGVVVEEGNPDIKRRYGI